MQRTLLTILALAAFAGDCSAAEAAKKASGLRPAELSGVADAAARLDAQVSANLSQQNVAPNAPVGDEAFIRRIYLDAAGRIPTAAEVTEFFADKAPNKRAKLIDRLLESPGYKATMFNYLCDMLRVMDKPVKRTPGILYEEWIKDEIAADRPWDEMVRAMLTAEGSATTSGPSGYLIRDQKMPLDNLSNTLTIFLGANVACAQCHDHPLAKWTQRDFFEMAGFFGATDTLDESLKRNARKIINNTNLEKNMVLNLIEPNASVITDMKVNKLVYPKDFKGHDAKPGEKVIPELITWEDSDAKNPAYKIDTKKPETLRYEFARWLTHPQNPRFAATIANRLWKRVFGLAAHEPVTDLDDIDGKNAGLVKQLAAEMVRVRFDLREYQRILFNTQAYQRMASGQPDLEKGPYLFPGPLLRRLTAEQAWDSVLTLVAGESLDEFKLSRADLVKKMALTQKDLTPEGFKTYLERVKDGGGMQGIRQSLGGGKKGGGTLKGLKNQPEYLHGLPIARASELPQPSDEASFLRMFGQSDRQIADGGNDEGSVPQVLMLMNGQVQSAISDPESLVMKAAGAQKSQDQQVVSLYMSFLGRMPLANEAAACRKALAGGTSISELTWVLFNTREFMFVQ